MGCITVLSEDIINKIAAGEVIERPASVVKELLENALDAGATRITVDIQDSGRQLIRVSDNGCGMHPEDARQSVLRHATSKIRSEKDLFAITTLGFRGEALASIAAVSQLTISTAQEGQVEGYSLVLEGGKLLHAGPIAAEQGTTVEVRNLFFNTPARKKFLKTDAVELRHIVEVVMQTALGRPDVAFRLTHESQMLLHAPATKDLRSTISSLYGLQLAKDLLDVYRTQDGITVQGYICKPHQARSDKAQQALYVNGRCVRSEEVAAAVYEAYHSLLFVGRHPLFVLNLTVDPEKIDVNVHPQKTVVKFEQKKTVFDAVYAAVRETLQQGNLLPVMDFSVEQQEIAPPRAEIPLRNIAAAKFAPHYPFEPSVQSLLRPAEEYSTPEEEVFIPEQWKEELVREPLPPLKVLGQIHYTFFVAETVDGVVFIDQHVVQERVLYEKFMGQLLNKHIAIQTLLRGELLELTPAEIIVVTENQPEFEKMGFAFESFGGNTILLKTIPAVFGRLQPKELLYEIIAALKEGRNRLEEIQESIITRMACRASVKAGEEMTIAGIQALLEELALCKLPYTCPHGRSVLIKVTVDELEKKFHRK